MTKLRVALSLQTITPVLWLSLFLLLNYSNPPSLTFRLSFLLVALAAAWYLYSVFARQLFRVAADESWPLLFVLGWFSSSLLTVGVTQDAASHVVNLGFGLLSFLAGLALGRVLLNPKRDVIVIWSIVSFVFVNFYFCVGQEPGTDEFAGVFRDRNFLSFTSVMLLWLLGTVASRSIVLLILRALLVSLVVLTASVAGLVLLAAYGVSIVILRVGVTRQGKLKAAVIPALIIAVVMLCAGLMVTPAAERASRWAHLLMHGLESVPETSSPYRRIAQVKEGWRLINEHPLFGVGFGSAEHYTSQGMTLHNTYLEVTASAGLTSGALFFLFPTLLILALMLRCGARSLWAQLGLFNLLLFFGTYTAYQRLGPMFFFGLVCLFAFREFATTRSKEFLLAKARPR